MKLSRRARRMARHHRRHRQRYTFNLVSLMDIFTILVFFLLVNSADVQTLPNPKELTLPDSTAETEGRQSVVVMVTREGINLGADHIISIEDALASEEATIPALSQALAAAEMPAAAAPPPEPAAEGGDDAAEAGPPQREVTIMADEKLPYRLLKKVMLSCTAADFGRISLAVMREGQG
ncbi:putative adventurous gliding motility protein S [Salinisphaera sp. PC39]|uniref:ExbD/TolR family protein n=1 Tax=Salinisphaera sp. PC39 TaxID=1304156 RepID=UPI003341DA2A